AKFLEVLHNGPSLTDVSCSYKLFSRDVLKSVFDLFPLSSGKEAFSAEIMTWVIRRGWRPIEIPVIYKQRVGTSMYTGDSIFKAAKIGFKMVLAILRYRFLPLETVPATTKGVVE
ncbi:MAG: hypothetical protein WCT45_01630, partial [Candidatus Paceibacterota bacterium]